MPDEGRTADPDDRVPAVPAAADPAAGDPTAADPAGADRVTADRSAGDLSAADPSAGDPAASDRSAGEPADESGPVRPTEEWLVAHAVEGRVRRAPRLGSFVVAGVLAGLVLGTVLTLLAIRGSGLAPDGSGGVLPMLGGYNGVLLVTSAALGLVGGLAGAALGLRADRRSRR